MAFTDTDVSAYIYPEDQGTGVAAGFEDWDNAAHEGAMGLAQAKNYVQQGLSITADFGNNQFSLSQGLAFIEDTTTVGFRLPSENETSISGSWPFGRLCALGVFAESGIALQDTGGLNHVYLAFSSSGQDDAFIRVADTTSDAPDPSIRIGILDANNNDTTEVNRISGLDWNFDGSVQVSSASTLTYNVVNNYDEWRFRLKNVHGDNTSRTVLGGRVNGVSSGYAFRNTQGNASGNSQWQIAHNRPDVSEIIGEVYVAGRWNRECSMNNEIAGNDGKQYAFTGNVGATSPLNSFTLFWTSGSISGTLQAWGRDRQ
jgi:hypothetical protein